MVDTSSVYVTFEGEFPGHILTMYNKKQLAQSVSLDNHCTEFHCFICFPEQSPIFFHKFLLNKFSPIILP